jgi:hypothetical protein
VERADEQSRKERLHHGILLDFVGQRHRRWLQRGRFSKHRKFVTLDCLDSQFQGKEIFDQLVGLAKRNISIEINQDATNSFNYPYAETQYLESLGAKVRLLELRL